MKKIGLLLVLVLVSGMVLLSCKQAASAGDTWTTITAANAVNEVAKYTGNFKDSGSSMYFVITHSPTKIGFGVTQASASTNNYEPALFVSAIGTMYTVSGNGSNKFKLTSTLAGGPELILTKY